MDLWWLDSNGPRTVEITQSINNLKIILGAYSKLTECNFNDALTKPNNYNLKLMRHWFCFFIFQHIKGALVTQLYLFQICRFDLNSVQEPIAWGFKFIK